MSEEAAVKVRKRDRIDSESRLLKAAREIFAKDGFKAATTRMIAKKAGINESLIGRYFEGKVGLLVALIERHVAEEGPYPQLPYPPQENVTEELLAFARFKFDREGKQNFDFFKIVLSQAIVDPKFSKRIREKIPMFFQPELAHRLEALQRAGKIHAHVNIAETIKTLDIFIFGNIVAQRIIAGTPLNESASTIDAFIRDYARVLDAECELHS
jgi:AcrR family transcriptional regulator